MSILVIGDLILDINYYGDCNRIAPEAPIPVVKVTSTQHLLGGAANITNNLVSMGTKTHIIGVIGYDENGVILKNLLDEKNIETHHIVIDASRPTTSKHRVFTNNKLVSRFDVESSDGINNTISNLIKQYVETLIDSVDIIILSDYLKGVLTHDLTKYIIDCANGKNKHVYIDPKDKNYDKYKNCTLIKPNKTEAELILGEKITLDNMQQQMIKLKEKINCKICLLTLSENGLAVSDDNMFQYLSALQKKNVIDVTGAGDTVMSSFTYYYHLTKNLLQSAQFANFCGQLKITHMGTYAITPLDIINYKRASSKVIDINDIGFIVKELKKENKKIIFTNGCFDVLHYGHINYLEEAKQLGDILVIGLNSDDSIKRLKGANRPINSLKYRVKQLEVLNFVDFIIVFNTDTPLELIKVIEPTFLVKGGDYNFDNVVGREYAKEVKLLDYVNNISSTKIINLLECPLRE